MIIGILLIFVLIWLVKYAVKRARQDAMNNVPQCEPIAPAMAVMGSNVLYSTTTGAVMPKDYEGLVVINNDWLFETRMKGQERTFNLVRQL